MKMRFLSRERDTLEELFPGLDSALTAAGLADLERPKSTALKAFKAAGGPALLVPREHAGLGASAVQAVRVQRALASRSPSLAVATTMHHFSVASLIEAAARSQGFEWMLLEAIARDGLLLASGFAEGRTGQAILSPTMRAEVRDGKVVLNGSKKPCSLAHSMDLLTASIALPAEDGAGERMAVALIPKGTEGIAVRPFWESFVLAGAESDEVVLTDVEIPMDLVVRTQVRPGQQLDHLQTAGFVWFELLMTASYAGVASALVERVLAGGKAGASLRAEIAVQIEAVMAMVEGVAAAVSRGHAGERAFADALVCRYAAQDAIGRVVRRGVEALGGMSYIGSGDVAYLAAASAALAFHPPSRARMAQPLCDYFAGQPLRVA
jgi:alkylation response protein AidB-like acyl-CoA dehydrogenase